MWSVMSFMIITLGLILSMSTYSWMMIWLSMEMLLMMAMPLMVGPPSSNESAMKYFLIQSLSGLLFLFGVLTPVSSGLMISIALILKMGLFPFYHWVPHVFSGVSLWIIVLLSTAMKLPGLILISHWKTGLLWAVFIMSVVLGGVSGAFTSSIKKVLGWSSVSHSGWMMGLTCMSSSWLTYMVLYSVILLSVASLLTHFKIKSVYNLSTGVPGPLALIISLSLVSLAGVPPFLGFMMKWVALIEIMNYSQWIGVGLLTCAVLTIYMYVQCVVYTLVCPIQQQSVSPLPLFASVMVMINLLGLVVGLYFL